LPTTEPITLIVYQDVTALKEAEALKDTFIGLATHELRTPVTILAGYADLLMRRAARGQSCGLDEWQTQKLKEMKEATYQLTKLTEDLLDVTRVQAGQFQLQCSPTDLVALTLQVVEQLQTTTEHHQISILRSPPLLWATVDTFRIEQVLYNLLSNAIKYSPQSGPIEITIEENTEPHEAKFSIRDYGLGIPHEQQSHLFGRFFRADNVRVARIGGTGLGLYLCRELVERHGGRIWFESEEGIGTTFFFTLPCNAEGMCSSPV
jgi:signal transduction histidine kinase